MTRSEYLDGLFAAYDLVSVLSEKNDCRVLRLRNRALGRDLVLHSLPRALPVYEILCGVDCPNLPRIYDAITLDDGQIVLEEFIDGLTVTQIMETGRYRYRGAKAVLKAVCAALSVMHEKGLVHRDVKPDNVMIASDGRVVLIDFNASRVHKIAEKDTVVMGTVGYAAPEQLGLAQSDERTDVYAAGMMLNVMLTGRAPGEQIAEGKAGRIIKKCLMHSPADRYRSARELAKAL